MREEHIHDASMQGQPRPAASHRYVDSAVRLWVNHNHDRVGLEDLP